MVTRLIGPHTPSTDMGPGRGSGSWGGGTRSRTGDSRALSHPRKAPHMLMPLALKHTSGIPTLLPHRACPQGQHRQTAAPCRRALQQEGEAGEEGRATGRGGWGPALATSPLLLPGGAWQRLGEGGGPRLSRISQARKLRRGLHGRSQGPRAGGRDSLMGQARLQDPMDPGRHSREDSLEPRFFGPQAPGRAPPIPCPQVRKGRAHQSQAAP